MAKIGYIFRTSDYAEYEDDKIWMRQYGCVKIVEDSNRHEEMRPQWKQLLTTLGRGDEIVVAKFSNAVRGSVELAQFIEYCRIKVVRIVSIRDKVDSRNELFPDTSVSDVLYMFGSLPEEITALRKASSHIVEFQKNIKLMDDEEEGKNKKKMPKSERDKTVISLYRNGYLPKDICEACGFKSRGTVYNILTKYGILPDRGRNSVASGIRPSKSKK